MVDPTGLKPAPHALKGRCAVTRAPGQEHFRFFDFRLPIGLKARIRFCLKERIGNRQLAIDNDLAVAEGFEPSHGRINSAVPYRLGYATKIESGCGDETRTRIISFTRRALCYPIELRRNLVDWEGFKPSQEVCRTSMLSLHHQPEEFGGCGWSRTTNLALMRRLL